MRSLWRIAAAAAVASVLAGQAEAKTFRLATTVDAQTLDPHAHNALYTYLLVSQIYEPLVYRNQEMKLEPGLAVSWTQAEPTRWRFHLRPGVKFADGSPFEADDVVFSLRRALAPTSNFSIYIDTVTDVIAVDPLTVDIVTRAPDAVIPDKLTRVLIMDRAWAEAHGSEQPQNLREREAIFAVRNANGTGPFVIKERQNDQRTIMVRNPNWWGGETSVTEYHHIVINSDATRVAALLSGEVDMIHTVPNQDVERIRRTPNLHILEGQENRTVIMGFDQHRDELLYASVKGRNPFKDVRVRRAVAQAIDINAIRTRTLRGQAVPTGSMWTQFVNGWSEETDSRLPLDRDGAKRLLAEAGYPDGFEVTMDCPVGAYDEACQAIAAQLAQVGIRIRLNILPGAQFSPKVLRQDTSMYVISWGVPTFDALYTLRGHFVTRSKVGSGSWNAGGYSNPQIDALVEKLADEADADARRAMIVEAHRLLRADMGYVPLYHTMIPWAYRQGITLRHRADNQLTVKDVTVE